MGRNYTELLVWQEAMKLAKSVYRVTRGFPKEEIYGIVSQMRRAAVSIPSNIAEGQGRATRGEFLNALSNARGSLAELGTQTILAEDLEYMSTEQAINLRAQITKVTQLLNGLIAHLKAKSSKIK